MRKKITLILAIAILLIPTASSFAQMYPGSDAQWQHECNQMALERMRERDKYNEERKQKAVMDQNGNYTNHYKEQQKQRENMQKFFNDIVGYLDAKFSALGNAFTSCKNFCKQANKNNNKSKAKPSAKPANNKKAPAKKQAPAKKK